MTTELALATIAHNAPRWIAEQIRLLSSYLKDDFMLTVYDSSSNEEAAEQIRSICETTETYYRRLDERMHHLSLNAAAAHLLAGDAPRIGFLDHDIFPSCDVELVPSIDAAGFYGVPQRHAPTSKMYLWPGFCFFSREWLNGRPLDFGGIRLKHPRDDGDTGSLLSDLFVDDDWEAMCRIEHGYKAIRKPDSYGLQSWGVEMIDGWIHFSNGSGWMRIPNPEERERLLGELLVGL